MRIKKVDQDKLAWRDLLNQIQEGIGQWESIAPKDLVVQFVVILVVVLLLKSIYQCLARKKNLNRVLKIKNYFEKDYYVLKLKVLDKMEMYVWFLFYFSLWNSTSPHSYHRQFVIFGSDILRPIFAHSKTYAIKDHENIIVFFLYWSQFLPFVVVKGLKFQISFLDYVISIILWRTFINKCNLQWKVILLVNSPTLLLRTMKLVTILIMNSFSFSQKSQNTYDIIL